MKGIIQLVGIAVLGLAPAAFGQTVAFENVNVIPMDRERVLERHTVVVRDGRILQIGPAASTTAPPAATRVDGSGKYLMPGLAEMHGHLTANYLPDSAKTDILYLYVANGVTTVRAMLGNPEAITTRDAIVAGTLLGPKLYVAGPEAGRLRPAEDSGRDASDRLRQHHALGARAED